MLLTLAIVTGAYSGLVLHGFVILLIPAQCTSLSVSTTFLSSSNQVPVEELVNGMVSHLPLKEDLEEYELVFKAFLTLFNAGHAVTPQCIPKIVESTAHFTTAHNVEKSDKSKVRK